MKRKLVYLSGVGGLLLAAFLGAKPYIAQYYGPGFDRHLDTSSNEKLVASVTTASANLYPDQAKALRWAVSDLNDETIKKRYPNATMREIVRGEAKGELAKAAAAKADAEKQLAEAIKVQSNVEKVVASDIQTGLGSDFFGPKMAIRFRATNDSQYSYSSLTWNAKLFLDDNNEPAAEATLFSSYAKLGGFKPGERITQNHELTSFSHNNGAWHTIEVRQAKKRRLEITVIPFSARDLGDRSIVDSSPLKALENIADRENTAKKVLQIADASPESCLFSCGPKQVTNSDKAEVSQSTQQNSVSCSNQCVNGNCLRTFSDGRQERWQAPRKYNPLSGDWEWETNSCGG